MTNESVLSLLEVTQEYARAMSEMQSTIVDGYMDIAETRKNSFGLSFTSLNIDENSRKIFTNEREVEEEREAPIVPGINQDQLIRIKKDFEKALSLSITIAKILGQINEKYDTVQKELSA